jgi:hypothetical protein
MKFFLIITPVALISLAGPTGGYVKNPEPVFKNLCGVAAKKFFENDIDKRELLQPLL